MNLDIEIMEQYVQRAVSEFDNNPLAMKLLRRLAREAPDLFLSVGLRYLNSTQQSPAYRFLATQLLRQDSLLDRLASPAYSSREAVSLFRRFLAVDPSFDVRFARKLPGPTYWNPNTEFDVTQSSRALDILEETSHGRRLLPVLGHLVESEYSGISAKATLFIGRRLRNPAWTKRQLERKDQRIRANAVEAIWGLNTPDALTVLEECLGDTNNRVVGNSLVGLHIAGRTYAQREVLTLSTERKPELRSTAAWAMGKLALPVFASRLTQLIRDEQPQVRSTALRALRDVRRRGGGSGDVAGELPESSHAGKHLSFSAVLTSK